MKQCINCDFQEHHRDAVFCANCGAQLVERTEPIQTTIWLHSERDSNRELGEQIGLQDEAALRNFERACYEIGLTVEVNPDTGETWLIGIEDDAAIADLDQPAENFIAKLERPIRVSETGMSLAERRKFRRD